MKAAAAGSLIASALLGCGGAPEPHTRIAGAAPEGTVDPGAVQVEVRFTSSVAPEGILDGRRLALCRRADADAVAAAAGSGEGIAAGSPAWPTRPRIEDGGRTARLEPERPLPPMGAWTIVVGRGIRDAGGRPVLDPSGRVRTWRHDFRTGDVPPDRMPRVALTEALARAAPPEAGGEYAELSNLGAAPADLAGFLLAKRTASGTQRCALEGGAPLPPGGFALVAGGAWDGRYTLPPETPRYRCGATALLGGLADDRPVALALESPGGALLSTLGWLAPAPLCAAGPLERIRSAGPDDPSNLTCSGIPTPGACNASAPDGECP